MISLNDFLQVNITYFMLQDFIASTKDHSFPYSTNKICHADRKMGQELYLKHD